MAVWGPTRTIEFAAAAGIRGLETKGSRRACHVDLSPLLLYSLDVEWACVSRCFCAVQRQRDLRMSGIDAPGIRCGLVPASIRTFAFVVFGQAG
jgi:hypothetical protein